MGRILKLDRATKAGIPNANGITYDKESFYSAFEKDKLELLKNGYLFIEAAPHGLSEMMEPVELYNVHPDKICAKIISIDDEQAEIEVTDEKKFSLVDDPVISFVYTGNVKDNYVTIIGITKIVIMPRDICYRR